MPNISDLTDEQWNEVEQLAVAGLSYEELANRYQVEAGTIRVRAHRKKWAVPSRVQRLQKMLKESGLNTPKSTGLVDNVTESNVAVQIAENIAEYGQKGQLAVLKGLLPKIQETFRENSALLTKEIESWKDAGTAFGIFAKASGLDKPAQAVQVNLWQQPDEREGS